MIVRARLRDCAVFYNVCSRRKKKLDFSKEDDGVFWMSFQDFRKSYPSLYGTVPLTVAHKIHMNVVYISVSLIDDDDDGDDGVSVVCRLFDGDDWHRYRANSYFDKKYKMLEWEVVFSRPTSASVILAQFDARGNKGMV